MDEMVDAITGGNDIGLYSANTPEKMQEYWLKNDTKLFLNHVVPEHRNSSRKSTAIFIRR